MIKVVEVRPSIKNPDWIVITVQNDLFPQEGERSNINNGYKHGKMTSFPVLKDNTEFSIGLVMPELEIVTQKAESPLWEDQEPYADGYYYRNIIVEAEHAKEAKSRGSDRYYGKSSTDRLALIEDFLAHRCFPMVKIPSVLQDIRNGNFPGLAKPAEPCKPIRPGKKLGGLIMFFCCLLSFFTVPEGGKEALVQIILLFISGVWLFLDVTKNSEKKKQYEARLTGFNQAFLQYQALQKEYERLILMSRSPEKVEQLKQEKILLVLQDTPSFPSSEQFKKGASEKYFLTYLNYWFPDEIHTNLVIDAISDTYKPDFTFKSYSNNLHIDIEIDEPYILGTSTPIHYLEEDGVSVDSRRNTYFLENNWVVIRFAEEQVIKTPNECCHLIANTIYEVTRDSKYLEKFRSEKISFPKYYLIWSPDSAADLAINKSREAYLALIGRMEPFCKATEAIKSDDNSCDLPF